MRIRPWELVPELVLALGLGTFLVTETDAATSAFGSRTALLLMGGATLAWLVARATSSRLPDRWAIARTAAFAVAAAGVLAVVVLPAYDDTTVVEVLPVDAATPEPVRPDDVVSPTSDPPATTTSVAPGPRLLAEGALAGIDHRASGTVRLFEQPSGATTVGLEDIDIQPGPDYDVFLVPGADRRDVGDGIRLDDLRGNKGTQYYDVPPGTDLAPGGWTVLVWCQTFDVPVAAATPR